MQAKPIFIGFAAALVVLVIAAAAFFSGLYLGQRGYVADLQSRPQNSGLPAGNSPQSGPFDGAQDKPAAGQPAQSGIAPGAGNGPSGAPSWPPDVTGRVTSVTEKQIVLNSPQGIVTVALNADTKFLDDAGNSLVLADIQVGNVVGVFGRDVATVIMRLPLRPNAP